MGTIKEIAIKIENGETLTPEENKIAKDSGYGISKLKNKPQIKVFITKTKKFRAKIRETKDTIPYEVTIGGKSWKDGKGRKYEVTIKHKCELLLNSMKDEFLNF